MFSGCMLPLPRVEFRTFSSRPWLASSLCSWHLWRNRHELLRWNLTCRGFTSWIVPKSLSDLGSCRFSSRRFTVSRFTFMSTAQFVFILARGSLKLLSPFIVWGSRYFDSTQCGTVLHWAFVKKTIFSHRCMEQSDDLNKSWLGISPKSRLIWLKYLWRVYLCQARYHVLG